MSRPSRILLVTGLAGAGRTTVLKTLEDLGWEAVDNLPLSLLDRLLSSPTPQGAPDEERPLAIGIDSRTRGFDAAGILRRVARLREEQPVGILFLDAADAVLAQRFSATRRRHPLAIDRPAETGIASERDLLEPLRDAAEHLIDTSELTSNALQQEIRTRFGGSEAVEPTLVVSSFSYARGLPRDADLVLDMRFLRNPHWDEALRPGTGLDADVAAYIAADPAYAPALDQIGALLKLLLPRYEREGKSYITIAFGCTGGRHRSVHAAETIGKRLRAAGFSPTIAHRDLAQEQSGTQERKPDDGIAIVTVSKMIGLVLVTHGQLAAEFVRAMEHVVGPQEAIEAICIGPEDDMEARRADIARAVAAVDQGRGVILLTDLFGGTPSNLAISLMEPGRVEVIAGVNLPMLIRLEGARKMMKVQAAVAAAREAGRKYISVASEVLGAAAA